MIRSFLCTPLHLQDMLLKLNSVEADALILDLEDGVRQNYKEAARESLVENWDFFSNIGKKIFIRINKFHSADGIKDLLALSQISPDYIILPKIESSIELGLIRNTLPESIKLCPIIETPKGVKLADEIINSMSKGEYLFFGEADLTSELRISLYSNFIKDIKRQLVLVSAENKIDFVDSPCFRMSDNEFLIKEIEDSLESGFAAKIAIHPSHLKYINDIFDKRYLLTEKENLILENYSESNNKLGNFDGDMIGPPMIKKILNKNELKEANE